MNSFLIKYKAGQLILGIITVLIGLLLIIISFVDPNIVGKVLSYVLAIILFIIGAVVIVLSLVADTKNAFTGSLIYGSLAIAIGVVLIARPDFLTNFIALFMGVFLIAFGGVELIKGIFLVVYKAKVLWFVVTFIIAAICLTLGILTLVYPDKLLQIIEIIAGSLIVIYGVLEIIVGIKKLSSKDNKAEVIQIENK